VRALPGTEAAGMAYRQLLGGTSGMSTVFFARDHEAPGALDATDETIVTPDYFSAVGIPLLRGRAFTELDTATAPPGRPALSRLAHVVRPMTKALTIR
jgi:hypothetical protein